MEIEYSIDAVQDDIPVRGNAMASGDDAADRAYEDEILARLDAGDVWAWACVTVVAKCEGFEGRATLGACSYENEAKFRECGYFADLCNEAREDLLANVRDARTRAARIDASAPVADLAALPTHFVHDDTRTLCEACAKLRGIDLGDPSVEVWEVMSSGWLAPVVCDVCKLSLPVIVDGNEPKEDEDPCGTRSWWAR